jgi:hypothetical protein
LVITQNRIKMHGQQNMKVTTSLLRVKHIHVTVLTMLTKTTETFYLVWMMEFIHCKYRQPFSPAYTYCGVDWKCIYFGTSLNVNKNYTIKASNKVKIFFAVCSWNDCSCGSTGPKPVSLSETVIIYRVSEFESWSLTLSCAAQTRDREFELTRGKDIGEMTKYRDWVCENGTLHVKTTQLYATS